MDDSEKIPAGTFDNQVLLPKLPIPDLDETCTRFIEWVTPLLDRKTLDSTVSAAREFASEDGAGPVLQSALRDFAARKETANWLEPFWEWMYLSGRAPLPFYSNIFYMFDRKEPKGSKTQSLYAAELVSSALAFKSLVENRELSPDLEKGRPICMIQYMKLFSSARIPQKGVDRIRNTVSREDQTSPGERHIVVLRGGRFFAVDVIDENGVPLSLGSLERSFSQIINLDPHDAQPVGVLTTLPRDEWAEARTVLKMLSKTNGQILDAVESSLFVLCLEESQPEGIQKISETMLIGDGRSRWFDKGMQFIVCPDGTTAINMEHTVTDGSIMVRFAGFVHEDDPGTRSAKDHCKEALWEELRFDLNDEVRKAIERAAMTCDEKILDTPTRVLLFRSFGKERIKQLSVAPDSFVQMGLQLAQHDVWGSPRSTYEAVMTRQYLHGRTEAVRSVSVESEEFVRSMRDPSASNDHKAAALRRAAEKHVSRMKEARSGRGVERHLFGLSCIYREMGQDIGVTEEPPIFSDPGRKALSRTLLSTSTSATDGMFLAGFGTVDDEGLGVRYLTFPDSVHFNVTSRKALEGEMERFVDSLRSALLEMEEILDKGECRGDKQVWNN